MYDLYTLVMNRLLDVQLVDNVSLLSLIVPYMNLRDQTRFGMTSDAFNRIVNMAHGSYEMFRDRLIRHFDLSKCTVCDVWRRDIFFENCGHCEEPLCEHHNDHMHCNECSRIFCDDCIQTYVVICEDCHNYTCVHCTESEDGYTYYCNSCANYL